MHLVYVADSVDELIYSKADWTDLTGKDANHYWRWKYGADHALQVAEPPRTPLPTEEQAWDLLGRQLPAHPVPWPGVPAGQEYSVKMSGAVHNEFGAQISNPQGVDRLVARVRGREGGRFRVTPEYKLVLVWQPGDDARFLVVGRLSEPFKVLSDGPGVGALDLQDLKPGDVYEGPGDKKGGTFKVSQRSGGVIERKVKGGAEAALTEGAGPPEATVNARNVLAAWDALDRSFSRFFVNSIGHAWFEGPTGRRFIASVEGGFAWPDD